MLSCACLLILFRGMAQKHDKITVSKGDICKRVIDAKCVWHVFHHQRSFLINEWQKAWNSCHTSGRRVAVILLQSLYFSHLLPNCPHPLSSFDTHARCIAHNAKLLMSMILLKNRRTVNSLCGIPPFLILYFIFYRINKEITVVGRNPSSSDIFLDSNKNKVMISRLHARIISEKDATGKHTFKISDTSLNGTYINDVKISDSCDLNPGDTVTFGHLKGAVLPPGVVAQQPDSEFRFKVSSLFEYIHFRLHVHSHGIRWIFDLLKWPDTLFTWENSIFFALFTRNLKNETFYNSLLLDIQ